MAEHWMKMFGLKNVADAICRLNYRLSFRPQVNRNGWDALGACLLGACSGSRHQRKQSGALTVSQPEAGVYVPVGPNGCRVFRQLATQHPDIGRPRPASMPRDRIFSRDYGLEESD